MARVLSKYIWLAELINRKPYIKFHDINNAWLKSSLNDDKSSLPIRTFHNHREEIRNILRINIACHKASNSYYIESDNNESTATKRWLINSISLDNLVTESQDIRDRIELEEVRDDNKFLFPIAYAMKDDHELEMTYQSFWNKEPYTTSLQPYFLKLFNQRWYVIGKTERHPEELRTYALDRISNLSTTEKVFRFPEDFSANDHYRNFFGIFHTNEKPEKVIIKATLNQQSFLRSLPLHSSQTEIETHKDYSLFEYWIVPTYDFVQELLSKADTIEVLQPESLRNEIKRLISNMLKSYE